MHRREREGNAGWVAGQWQGRREVRKGSRQERRRVAIVAGRKTMRSTGASLPPAS